jgi:hypothetical protein
MGGGSIAVGLLQLGGKFLAGFPLVDAPSRGSSNWTVGADQHTALHLLQLRCIDTFPPSPPPPHYFVAIIFLRVRA